MVDKVRARKIRKREALWGKWRRVVNMRPSELEQFLVTDEGRRAGLTPEQAMRLGIGSGQESARWLLAMLKSGGRSCNQALRNWDDEEWSWARRQVSFVSRMSANAGPLWDRNGRRTRKHTSLLLRGHSPVFAMRQEDQWM